MYLHPGLHIHAVPADKWERRTGAKVRSRNPMSAPRQSAVPWNPATGLIANRFVANITTRTLGRRSIAICQGSHKLTVGKYPSIGRCSFC
jgi:hypothetical protein